MRLIHNELVLRAAANAKRFWRQSFLGCSRLRPLAVVAAHLLGACTLAAIPRSARAEVVEVVGFTGIFSPTNWVVVNTNPAQTLSTTTNFSCDPAATGPGPPNKVACVDGYVADGLPTDYFNLKSSEAGYTGGGASTTTSITTLTITNTYWRPWRISFNWNFCDTVVDDTCDLAFGDYTQASLYLDPGFISPNDGTNDWIFTTTPDVGYYNQTAAAYLPPGATINFSVTTNNTGPASLLNVYNFDAVEIPAPLPITGGGAAFACSRRLRRRQRHARRQLLAMPGTASGAPPGPGALRALRAERQQRQAIQHYGALLGRPVRLAAASRPPHPAAGQSSGQPEIL